MMRRSSMKRLVTLVMILALAVGSAALAEETPVRVLLLGTDRLGETVTGEEKISRSDAIYVFSLHPKDGRVKLLGIERDYLVKLPEGHGKNKLATATFFGGPQMSLGVVNDLLKLDVKHYVQIDIDQIIAAVDVIGGLDLMVEEQDLAEVNYFIGGILEENVPLLSAGMQHLNGMQVWAFAGARDNEIDNIESNKARQQRQQRVVKAGLQKLHEMSFDEAMDALDKVLPYVNTNMTMNDLISVMQSVQDREEQPFEYLRSPSTGYKRARAGMHQVVVAEDMNEEIKAVHAFLGE